jgi:hypothetical protein
VIGSPAASPVMPLPSWLRGIEFQNPAKSTMY